MEQFPYMPPFNCMYQPPPPFFPTPPTFPMPNTVIKDKTRSKKKECSETAFKELKVKYEKVLKEKR